MASIATGTHFAILQLGVSIWNQWRAAEPLTVPNLRNADLSELHLENVNLCRANLRGAKLSKTYLYDADFQGADLREADLTRALLIGANLHRANLAGATLQQAYLAQSDLSNADFTGAQLQKADLKEALLTSADFANARIAEADLATSFDLTQQQLNSAVDAHLACFDRPTSAGLTLAPAPDIASTKNLSTEETEHLSTEKSVAEGSGSIDVFEPVTRAAARSYSKSQSGTAPSSAPTSKPHKGFRQLAAS